VVEILRHLAEVGSIEQRDGRWEGRGELSIPDSVRQVVAQRLSRLSEDANRALRMAAVAGTDFEPDVVQRAAGLDEDTVLGALEEVVAARLVVEAPPSYRFAHDLVRSTLYEGLTAARRVALHRGVAGAIEELHEDRLAALAHHWARASDPRAVGYAARAGDQALARLAHDEAVGYYRQALELASDAPADEDRRLRLLIALGEAQRRAGDPGHRQTLLDAGRLAQERGDGEALAAAALANSRRGLWSAAVEVDEEKVAMLEQAVATVAGSGSGLEARLRATLGLELVYADRERRVRLSDEALQIARRGDPDTLAEVLLARYYTTLAPWTLDQQLADSAELLHVVRGVRDPMTVALAASVRYRVLMQAGDAEGADRCLAFFTRAAGELGQPTLRWISTYLRAGRSLLAGQIDEGERLAVEASELGTATGQPEAALYVASQLIVVRFEQGRLSEMEGPLVALCAMYPQLHAAILSLALTYCELERHDEARERFEAAIGGGFDDIPLNHVWLPTLCWCALIAARLGDEARAEVLEKALEPYAEQLAGVAITYWGSVSWYLGLLAAALGRPEDAEARFAQAEAIHQRVGAQAWLARTRLEWARINGSQKMLEQALAAARRLGLAKVERDALVLSG
jgi:hypothetical protein